jgi:hypothetical protein
MSAAAKGNIRRVPTRIVVVIAGANPTFDYYLSPRLDAAGSLPVQVVDIGNAPTRVEARTLLAGALVLFCRYTSATWMRAVESCGDVIAGAGLFVDDDIAALANDNSIPLFYRLRLLRLHLLHSRRLTRNCDLVYVATPALQRRLEAARPRLLTPIAGHADMPVRDHRVDRTLIAFHSTSVHWAEHRWLRPVIGSALKAEPLASFEVMAGPPLSWHWRGLPRTEILTPLPWPRYRAESRERGADLLLAPLLPTRANAARSWTKRIDAMRMGAALLVSDPNVYRPDPEEEELGMCVPLDPAAWTDAIVNLARDRTRLARLRDLNRAHVLRASAVPSPLITPEMLPRA